MRLESNLRVPVSAKGRCTLQQPHLLPDVALPITNLNAAEEHTALTGNKGLDRATNLVRGRYELTAALAGFKTHARSDVELTVREIKRVDFRLEPGKISVRVTITGKTPVVNTEEGRISTLVTEAQISSLPLNGRNVFPLASTQLGP